MTHLATIAAMPCVICQALGLSQATRTECHHVREGQGMAQRAPDELALPVCAEHHRGPTGIHGDRSAWRQADLDELGALALTLRAVLGTVPHRTARKAKSPNQSTYTRPQKVIERTEYRR